MARKKKHEEHVNHERWLVSYADFMTLLFAFFTSLYAISTVDAKKAGKMVFSTRAAFDLDFFPTDKPVLGTDSRSDAVEVTKVEEAASKAKEEKRKGASKPLASKHNPHLDRKTIESVYQELTKLVRDGKVQGVTLVQGRDGLVVSLRDAAFFGPGSAELKPEARRALDPVLERLIETQLDIRIEGHTDDSPPGPRFSSNWELSTARAVSVLRHLTLEFAYPPERLSVAGYASYRPQPGKAPTAAPEAGQAGAGKVNMRRVDLVLLSRHAPAEETPPKAPDPEAAPPAHERGSGPAP